MADHRPRPRQGRGLQEKIEVADRLADEAGEEAAQAVAGETAHHAPGEAEDEYLHEEGGGDLTPARPEAHKYRRVLSPARNRKHGRVVDKKDADEKRDERKGFEVEPEGAEHARVYPLLLLCRLDPEPFPVAGKEGSLISENKVDAVDLCLETEEALGMAYVHDDERLGRRARKGAGEAEMRPSMSGSCFPRARGDRRRSAGP